MIKRIYLDNAATTPVDPEVVDVITEVMNDNFGNPSSIHHYGRRARAGIEKARKTIANYLNASVGEIFFTSGGTESNNMALKCSVRDLGVTRIISSPLEHHCVLHAIERLEKEQNVQIDLVRIDSTGEPKYEHLEELLQQSESGKTLVSLMHANNEIGTLTDIERIGHMCREAGAYFHSDTVQSIAHLPIDLTKFPVDFISGAAHKFHGPKGVGFLYINADTPISPYIDGGAQERNMRAGTENITGIAGMAKAMELAMGQMEDRKQHMLGLRNKLKNDLIEMIPGISFNGPEDEDNLLYTILSVNFPAESKAGLLVFKLDINGIAASGGSACSSGANQGSHVIEHLLSTENETSTIRFSFSHNNTMEEMEMVLDRVGKIFNVEKQLAD